MKKTLYMALFLMSISSTSMAFDFKGIEVGGKNTTAREIEEALQPDYLKGIEGPYSRGIKCGEGIEHTTICDGSTSIGGEWAGANVSLSKDGVVTRIELTTHSYSFFKVVDVAVKKYGKPTKKSREIEQNGMGVKFANHTYRWQGKNGNYIEIIEYYPNFKNSKIYFGTAEDTKFKKRISEPKTKDI
ncbi:MAG: hypothetical protein NTY00_08030 [Deltaproteobacteria bacterium]|nr:hypothetical protein [Deltaproteobacteria bacterium]